MRLLAVFSIWTYIIAAPSPRAFVFSVPQQTEGATGTISVTILHLHSDKGKVCVRLYNSEEGYPKDSSKAFRRMACTIAGDTCTLVFENIPAGVYAIACYHDENDNNELDTNFLGIPKEGVGASNNARGSFGPPKFKDAKFIVNGNAQQTITIEY
jgi:uncharacterized protein (DUF2141 family)